MTDHHTTIRRWGDPTRPIGARPNPWDRLERTPTGHYTLRNPARHPYVLGGMCAGGVWADGDAVPSIRYPAPRRGFDADLFLIDEAERMLPDAVLADRAVMQFPRIAPDYRPFDPRIRAILAGIPIPASADRPPWLRHTDDEPEEDTEPYRRDTSALVAIAAITAVIATVIIACWIVTHP